MNAQNKTLSICAFVWAVFTIIGFSMLVLAAPIRNYDVYDVEGSMQALSEQPLLIIGGQVAFAWAGVALIFLVLAFQKWLPAEPRTFSTGAATVFGCISGTLFILYGLVGGFAYAELNYLRSVLSAEYIQDIYLPVTLLMNRTLAAALTVAGFWFALANRAALNWQMLSRLVAYVGIAAGVIALPGFLLPGGGFSILSMLISVVWGVLAGFHWLHTSQSAQAVA